MDAKLNGKNLLEVPVSIRNTAKTNKKTFSMEGVGRKAIPYMMIAPAMIISAVFMIYPIIYMVYLSFFKWNMIGDMKYIGLENYLSLLTDSDFIKVLLNTCQFTVGTVAGFIIFGLLLALYLNKNTKINRFLQSVVFTPYVVSLVSIAFIWMWIMDDNLGLLNYVLNFFGIDSVKWLSDPKIAMWSLVLVNIWKGTGYYALIFLSALQSIPSYLYEAAELDRAGRITTFFKITLPMLSPTMFFLVLTGTIASFKVFETINIMTLGGPGNATNTLVYYIYEYGFKYYKIGYASAVGVVLMVIVGLLTLMYFGVLQKKVHYQ